MQNKNCIAAEVAGIAGITSYFFAAFTKTSTELAFLPSMSFTVAGFTFTIY